MLTMKWSSKIYLRYFDLAGEDDGLALFWAILQFVVNGRLYREVFTSFVTGLPVFEMRLIRLYEACFESVPQIGLQTYYLTR